MPNRSSKTHLGYGRVAKRVADLATEQIREKDPAAVALGRRGGLKGGKARAAKLSKERRQEIARKAAEARWAKRNPSS